DANSTWSDVDGLLCFAHDVFVRDNRAYIVEWDAGTFIIDVSNPAQPRAITRIGGRSAETLASIPSDQAVYHSLSMPGNHHTAMVNQDASLLVLNKEAWKTDLTNELDVDPLGEVEIWDIRDERSPEKLSTIEAPNSMNPTKAGINTTPHNFDIVGDRLYTSWYDGGVKIHDISQPRAPELLAWWRAPREWTFWTAQYATENYFIASSHSRGQYNDNKGGLFTFPNEAGKQQSPPALTKTTSHTSTSTSTSTASRTRSTTTTTKMSTTSPATSTSDRPSTSPTSTTPGASMPGFGLLAAIGGMALGLWVQQNRE
ncbi:MAG: LVIVD repeat-containing protein, partial [Halobacteriaceae archaeon]